VVPAAKRPPVGERALGDLAGDRLHHGDFEQLRYYVAASPKPLSAGAPRFRSMGA
jgi:hypothetical protein